MNKAISIVSTFLFPIVLMWMLPSCKPSTIDPIDVFEGKNFYPIEVGKFVEYKVDSTIYDDFTGLVYIRTSYIKEIIDTAFTDLQGRKNNYVIRYYKSHIDSNYEFRNVFYVNNNESTIEVVDGNLRFVKLIFPITFKGSWEGNKYISSTNTSDPNNWYLNWLYKYENFDKPLQLDSLQFAKTVTVLQNNFQDGDTSGANTLFADFSYSREQYARNIGLVAKDIAKINKDQAISNGKRKGFIVKMQAIAHN